MKPNVCLLFLVILIVNIREIRCTGSSSYYMDDVCGTLLDMESSAIESVRMEITRDPIYYNNMDCVVYLRAPQDKQFEVKILQNYIVSSPGCENDFFQIFDGPDMASDILPGLSNKVCASSILKPYYTSSTRDLVIRFMSDKSEGADGFKILFTAFRKDADDQCMDSEFQCSDSKRCISDTLVCDYNDDCTDASDDCSLSTATIVGIAVGCVAGVIIVIALVAGFCCFRKSRKRTGSTKKLSHTNSAEEYVTSVDDVDYAEIHYNNAPVAYGQYYRPMSAYSIKSDPYVINAPGYYTKGRHVWITAPPEISRVSAYSNPYF